jgi:hypothetical protein
VTERAISLSFFDPAHGLNGTARSGHTLLFEGSQPTPLADGPELQFEGAGCHASLSGHFELDFEPCSPPVNLDGVEVYVCRVTGAVGDRAVDCLGTQAETHVPPAWSELGSLRSVSAVFDAEHALLALAKRPEDAMGHGDEHVSAALVTEGELTYVEDARISTVYDGDGRQRSAGLELWMPEEEYPRRASGTVVAGSSLELEGLRVHAAVFRWRMDDREGAGAYELMLREEAPAAA